MDFAPGGALDTATSKADDTQSFGQSLSSLAQSLERSSEDTTRALAETRPKKIELLSKLAEEKPPAPPEIAKPEAPPKAAGLPDPLQSFGSFASVLGIFGGLLSRRPLTASLKAATAAIQGIKQGNQEAFQRNFDEWKEQSDYAAKVSDWQYQRYRTVLEQNKGNHDQIMSQLQVLASLDQDATALHTIRSGDLGLFEKMMDDRFRMIEGLKDSRLRVEQFAETVRHDKEMENSPERDAYFAMRKQFPDMSPMDILKGLKTAASADYTQPVQVEVPDGKGGTKSILAQQQKSTGQWVSADEHRTPLNADELKVMGKAGQASGREAVFTQRVITSANEAARDLANIAQLPISSSRGWFGGRTQGPGIMDAGREALANTMTSQDVQSYNVMATGFQRSLAAIETSGLAPAGSLTHQMDALLFKEGDTNLTKLQKMAQIRQIVDAGLEVVAARGAALSADQKTAIDKIVQSLKEAVPYTQGDLIRLQIAQSDNPNATLRDVAKQSMESTKDGSDIADKAKAAWGAYEPEKYDYRISPDGGLQRKLKDG